MMGNRLSITSQQVLGLGFNDGHFIWIIQAFVIQGSPVQLEQFCFYNFFINRSTFNAVRNFFINRSTFNAVRFFDQQASIGVRPTGQQYQALPHYTSLHLQPGLCNILQYATKLGRLSLQLFRKNSGILLFRKSYNPSCS